jgi:hypothetical protein
LTYTRTYTRFWDDSLLADLDKAITALERDMDRRAPYIERETLDRMKERVKVLSAGWHLCNEKVDA